MLEHDEEEIQKALVGVPSFLIKTFDIVNVSEDNNADSDLRKFFGRRLILIL